MDRSTTRDRTGSVVLWLLIGAVALAGCGPNRTSNAPAPAEDEGSKSGGAYGKKGTRPQGAGGETAESSGRTLDAPSAGIQARLDADADRTARHRSQLREVAALSRDEGDGAADILSSIPPVDRGWEWQYFWNRGKHKSKSVLQGHDSHVVALAFDPWGTKIASCGLDGRIQLWSLKDRVSIDSFQFDQEPRAKQYYGCEFDATGERLIVVSVERGLEIIDLVTRQSRPLRPLPAEVARRTRIARSPDGNFVAVACADQAAYVVPIPRKDQLAAGSASAMQTLAGHDAGITSLLFSGDGKQLLVGCSNGSVHVWNLETKEVAQTLAGAADSITAIAIHPRANLVMATSRDGSLRVWDRSNAAEVATARCEQALLDIAMLPNGTRLFTSGADGAVRVWDLILHGGAVTENTSQPAELVGITLKEVVQLGTHSAECHALALRRDGTCLVSAGGDFTVRVWDAVPESAREQPPAPPRHYVCYRAAVASGDRDSALVIDGRLNEPEWQQAPWSDEFVDIEGLIRLPPTWRTRVKMLWDDRALYLGVELEEPDVWGTLKRHDSVIFYDNDFEVFLDPDGDNHRYGEFEMNALNTGWDLFLPKPYKDGGGANDAWEISGIKTAVHVDGTINDPGDIDRGWSVEIAIPWSALTQLVEGSERKLPPQAEDVWRINFSRVEWQHEVVDGRYRKLLGRAEDNWVWSPQGVINMHRPEYWGYLSFSSTSVAEYAARSEQSISPFPDPAWHGKLLLQRVHDAQSEFRGRQRRWARNVEELGLDGLSHETLAEPLELQIIDTGYEVRAKVKVADGRTETWCIDADSRIYQAKAAGSP